MRLDFFVVISDLAIITMFIALWKAIEYRGAIPKGAVGRMWNIISVLVALFFVGYLTTPFFVLLPQEFKDVIVACLFFFGAVYVLITLRLMYRIINVMRNE